MISAILYEDNKNYREALMDVFDDDPKIFLAGAYAHAESLKKNLKDHDPSLVLMDIEMPGINGLDALKMVKDFRPNMQVLMQTQFDDAHRIFVALCRGASGYYIKSEPLENLRTAILEVSNGGRYFSPTIASMVNEFFARSDFQSDPHYVALTKRESEVLGYLMRAKKYQWIAEALYISYETVHSHVKNIYRKLHVSSKSEAILKALELKIK